MNRRHSHRSLANASNATSLSDDGEVYFDSIVPVPPPAFPRESSHQRLQGESNNRLSGTQATMIKGGGQSNREDELRQKYDLTPVDLMAPVTTTPRKSRAPSYSIDPWECNEGTGEFINHEMALLDVDLHVQSSEDIGPSETDDDNTENRSRFITPADIHPNMENKEEEIARLRLLAGRLSADWRAPDFMAPALARRIRDFQFAQEKRRKKYGDEGPWGILGLYDHLASIRIDVEWAEDAAIRRANGDSYQSWADFDEHKRGGSNRPYFTYALLFICLILVIASIAANNWQIEPLKQNPMIGPSADTLIRMGAKVSDLIVNEHEWWRLFSSTLLHAGLVHYCINMLALWFVGAAIEMTHGWVAAMIIFTLSAVGGAILSALFLPEYITVGASGGIFGFIGACLADIIMNWKLLFCDFVTENGKKHRHVIVVVVLLLDIVLNSLIGLTPFVDNFTHLGGMTYGFLCGLSTIECLSADFFGMEEEWARRAKYFLMRSTGLILTLLSLIVTLILLLKGDGATSPCPGCSVLSCVPFPPWAPPAEKWWHCDDCDRVSAEIVNQPNLHLAVNCPNGGIAVVDLSNMVDLNRDTLQRNLPGYCREYCPFAQPPN